jgi:hypothetical protein
MVFTMKFAHEKMFYLSVWQTFYCANRRCLSKNQRMTEKNYSSGTKLTFFSNLKMGFVLNISEKVIGESGF